MQNGRERNLLPLQLWLYLRNYSWTAAKYDETNNQDFDITISENSNEELSRSHQKAYCKSDFKLFDHFLKLYFFSNSIDTFNNVIVKYRNVRKNVKYETLNVLIIITVLYI